MEGDLRQIVLFLKVIAFTLVAPGSVTLLVPYLLLTYSHARKLPLGQFRYVGLVPLAIGACAYFRCLWDFAVRGRGTPAPIDPPKHLVVSGLYRYLRNPMYAGLLLVLLGEAVFFQARVLFGYVAVVFSMFYLFVLLYEEPTLRKQFGQSYERYCRAVPRWIPRTSAFDGDKLPGAS